MAKDSIKSTVIAKAQIASPVTNRRTFPTMSLEQQRAKFAWERVQGCNKKYMNLTKAAPALIMNNGLMQAMAFYQSKGEPHHQALNRHLHEWLHQRGIIQQADFTGVMQSLYQADPTIFRRATEESLELLRWIRQFAAAVCSDE